VSEAGVTTYITSSFVEFRELLQRHVRELEASYPERYSETWYFLRYVRRVRRRAHAGDSPRDCAGAMRGLTRYYVDAVADDSPLAARFEEILECHRYALRTERRD
jgi:hypothetical protein